MIGNRTRISLLMLALAAFAYNTSESFPVGLLPQIAGDLQVAESRVGLLLTVYAVIVAISVIPLVVMTSHVGRRRLILVTVLALAVSNLAISVAPTYEVLMLGRLLSATTHGIFWSMIAPTAAMLAPKGREGYATAMAFTGSSLAMVAGIPLVTAVGTAVGWRTAAAILGVLALFATAGLRVLLPPLPTALEETSVAARWRPFVALLSNRALIGICGVTIVVVVAYFATYTYISLFIERYTGLTGTGLSLVLFAFGFAGLLSVGVVGRFNDRYPRASAVTCFVVLAMSLAGISLFGTASAPGVIAAVVLLGASFTAIPVCLQAAVLRVAPTAGDVASAIYVVAFQIGIAVGSLLGGVALEAGLIDIVPLVAGGVALLTVVAVARLVVTQSQRESILV